MNHLLKVAGALVALPLLAPSPVLAKHRHAHAKADSSELRKTNSSAYPNAPGGTPAASDKGKPVEPKSDAGAKPDAPAKASTEAAPQKTGTPAIAYPGAPGGEPSSDKGKPAQP